MRQLSLLPEEARARGDASMEEPVKKARRTRSPAQHVDRDDGQARLGFGPTGRAVEEGRASPDATAEAVWRLCDRVDAAAGRIPRARARGISGGEPMAAPEWMGAAESGRCFVRPRKRCTHPTCASARRLIRCAVRAQVRREVHGVTGEGPKPERPSPVERARVPLKLERLRGSRASLRPRGRGAQEED